MPGKCLHGERQGSPTRRLLQSRGDRRAAARRRPERLTVELSGAVDPLRTVLLSSAEERIDEGGGITHAIGWVEKACAWEAAGDRRGCSSDMQSASDAPESRLGQSSPERPPMRTDPLASKGTNSWLPHHAAPDRATAAVKGLRRTADQPGVLCRAVHLSAARSTMSTRRRPVWTSSYAQAAPARPAPMITMGGGGFTRRSDLGASQSCRGVCGHRAGVG